MPSWYQSKLQIQSTVVTINGFDNFLMGVNFGEPHVATNPTDPLNSAAAWNISDAFYYTKNGVDWTHSYPTFTGFAIIGDPVLTFDSLGRMYYLQMYQNGNTYGHVIARSDTKGDTWLNPVSSDAFSGGLSDKPWITADQSAGPYSNYVYVGWRQFGSSGMRVVRSTDRGNNWSSPITLSGDQGAYVSVGPSATTSGAYAYFACSSGGSVILYRTSDGGTSWSLMGVVCTITGPGNICAGRYTVKNCLRTDNFPRMAVDNSFTSTRGNVYVTVAGNPPGPDNADIYLIRSTNYGQTWSTQIRVNDDNTTADQWMPCITVDKKTGWVYLMWYDSRNDPTGNLQTEMYGSVSTDGGLTFTPNAKISNASFNPNNMAVGQPGGENYIGDYIGNWAIGKTAINAWTDARANNMGSYIGYYPDYAMQVNPPLRAIGTTDSTTFSCKVPAIVGPYNDKVKFSATVDTLPTSGTINFSFVNGRDTVTTFPDSVILRVKTQGVPSKAYYLTIRGGGSNGAPAHTRHVQLYVGVSALNVGTNREGTCDFQVNGTTYNTRQLIIFPNGSNVNVKALGPKVVGGTQYMYSNWSDNGDTAHNVTINGALTLTANYKAQYKLILNSSVGNSFGGNNFYDSAVTFTFGVNSRFFNYNSQWYQFKGWTGSGVGSYTSADSSGLDTIVVKTGGITNPIVELARWVQTVIGIQNISTEIPKEYNLYQNYPNPFNPVTTIEFDIIKAGNAKIVLYDILGKEVQTVVNELVTPGKYKAQFDASMLSSGVYFYKLTANDFTSIKKLMLLK